MVTEAELRTEPFCRNGCKHVYEHQAKCAPPRGYAPAPDPSTYLQLSDENLVDTYDDLHADNERYSRPPIDWDSPHREYHRPTWEEACRRMDLVREEMLKRMDRTTCTPST